MSTARLLPHLLRSLRMLVCGVLACTALGAAQAADSRHLAPGFQHLPREARVVIMPTDIELFLVSAGGLLEPKADWTEAAQRNFRTALLRKKTALGLVGSEISDEDAEEFAEINALHAAVAQAIQLHHFGPSTMKLPTKRGKLDWSIGEPIKLIRERTGADYALFSWIRDSYASPERVTATIGLAVLGILALPGGMQKGYASLVDLSTGRIVWFNSLVRLWGDLRDPEKAAETVDALLDKFPGSR